jgi:phosphoadenylyl-sulfate reductase (thioredoxin)
MSTNDQDNALVQRHSALIQKYAGATARELLSAFICDEYKGRIALTSSFGSESAALLGMVAEIDPAIPLLFLQTQMLFGETLQYVNALQSRLGLTNLVFVEPDASTLDREDAERALWISDPDRCCEIRKVLPLAKVLAPYDCWITGLKRSHGGVRLGVGPIEIEDGRIKLNPLYNFTTPQIERLVAEMGLPCHPLSHMGYRSIGCIPCTRIGGKESDVRSGRWSASGKAECGIHSNLYRATMKAKVAAMEKEKASHYYGRRWFVTGASGTVGQELVRQIKALEPEQLIGVDHDETNLFFLKEKYRNDPKMAFFVTDLRDGVDLTNRIAGAEIVIHAAAYKHVILCEQSPNAAIQTNILGTQNLIEAAGRCDIERVLLTSSDKAVNPTNVMGTSKLMAERLFTAANAFTRRGKQIFSSTRFGNVLGSRGSVVPIFGRQIAAGGPVTITDLGMTRFIMTLSQAAKLVMDSVFLARGGEVFVTKMPVVKIPDLAQVMIDELAPRHGFRPRDIAIEIIGSKAGEKLYEELTNEEEVRRSIEIEDYIVVKPALESVYRTTDYVYPGSDTAKPCSDPYNSSTTSAMTKDQIADYLRTHDAQLLGMPAA